MHVHRSRYIDIHIPSPDSTSVPPRHFIQKNVCSIVARSGLSLKFEKASYPSSNAQNPPIAVVGCLLSSRYLRDCVSGMGGSAYYMAQALVVKGLA